jgi:hypothetical protein
LKKLSTVGSRASWSTYTSGGEGAGAKVFCFFFSKNKFFFFVPRKAGGQKPTPRLA